MTDNKTPIKRVNYTNGQLLNETDFQTEQSYHKEKLESHNRYLHTPGIASGLEVKGKGKTKIAIQPGLAIDEKGRQIELREEKNLIINKLVEDIDKDTRVSFRDNLPILLYVEFNEEEADRETIMNEEIPTRVSEVANFGCYISSSKPDSKNQVILAKLEVGKDDEDWKLKKVITEGDNKKYAGARMGDIKARSIQFEVEGNEKGSDPATSIRVKKKGNKNYLHIGNLSLEKLIFAEKALHGKTLTFKPKEEKKVSIKVDKPCSVSLKLEPVTKGALFTSSNLQVIKNSSDQFVYSYRIKNESTKVATLIYSIFCFNTSFNLGKNG